MMCFQKPLSVLVGISESDPEDVGPSNMIFEVPASRHSVSEGATSGSARAVVKISELLSFLCQ